MKYDVEITVRYSYTVEADGIDEATEQATDRWEQSRGPDRAEHETEWSTHTNEVPEGE